MDFGLKGKNVIVTGASRGIGRAIAIMFAEEGANIALCARGPQALDATKNELLKHNVKVHAQICDVADAKSLSQFIQTSSETLGGVDVLVNNASGFGLTDDEAGWQSGWNIDLMASVRATRQVAAIMAEKKSGAIIHISSISGMETGSPASYSAIKTALITHSKVMSTELAAQGIRVNCVSPGCIEFPGGLWDQLKTHDRVSYDGVRTSIPFQRMGTPEEVAAAVVFLASERASWISGANLVVDGSQHKGIF